MIRFEWDEPKNRLNRTKHGVWFEEAQSVFLDQNAQVFHDSKHSGSEDRYIVVGMSSQANVLVVVHCYKESDSIVRLISARKATRKEEKFYAERI